MTQDTRTFTFEFDDGTVVPGVTWHGVIDDNSFFPAEVNSMNNMVVGQVFDADFVVVTRTR